jgi:hypothetical protein
VCLRRRSASGTVVVDQLTGGIKFHAVDAKMIPSPGTDATGTFTLNFSGHLP